MDGSRLVLPPDRRPARRRRRRAVSPPLAPSGRHRRPALAQPAAAVAFAAAALALAATALALTSTADVHPFMTNARPLPDDAAVQEYNTDPTGAIATYGPVADWDVSAITDMSELLALACRISMRTYPAGAPRASRT